MNLLQFYKYWFELNSNYNLTILFTEKKNFNAFLEKLWTSTIAYTSRCKNTNHNAKKIELSRNQKLQKELRIVQKTEFQKPDFAWRIYYSSLKLEITERKLKFPKTQKSLEKKPQVF